MRVILYAFVFVVTISTSISQTFAAAVMRGDGPPPEATKFSISKYDPRLDEIVSANARLELLADGFGLNEGPVWVPDDNEGYLLFTGLLDNVIYKITPDKTVSVFMEFAGYTGDDSYNTGTQTRSGRAHVILIGPGCISIDARGRLVWCANNDRAIMRLEKDGRRTVVADNHNGKRFSGTNDLVIKSSGSIYFTDNDYGLRGAGSSPDKEMPNGVWLIKANGTTKRVISKTLLGGTPNGIALSPDEKYLYLSAGKKIMRYDVKKDETLGAGIVFSEGVGIGDGMKVDTKGNLYSTSGAGPGIVRIMAPDGSLLGTLNLPIYGGEPKKQICATNLAFGDNDGQTLFITACDAVFKIRMKAEGVLPGPKR